MYLIADTEMSNEDFLIGYPVSMRLEVDTRSPLEKCRNALEADCLDVQQKAISGKSAIARLMLARQDGVVTKEKRTTGTRLN